MDKKKRKEKTEKMIAKKKLVLMFTVFMLLTSLAMISVPVKSSPSPVTFSVKMPNGYIPGVPVGSTFWVNIEINASDLVYNSLDGIVGWGAYIEVNADVLKPLQVRTAKESFFLYDFANLTGYLSSPLVASTIDAAAGLIDVSEMLAPVTPGGAATDGPGGELPAPYKLVRIQFESLSDSTPTRIDILDPAYMTTNGTWVEAVGLDGFYAGIIEAEVGANLVGKSAWVEHKRFKRFRDGDEGVADSHGTPGYQGLYAKIKNTGELTVAVKASFKLKKGDYIAPLITTATYLIAPGVTETISTKCWKFDDLGSDDGKWDVTGEMQWQDPDTGLWVTGTKIKTTRFTVVP